MNSFFSVLVLQLVLLEVESITLTASNIDPTDYFGHSLSVSGSSIVVTSYLEDSDAVGVNGNEVSNSVQNSGAAYVFIMDGSSSSWIQEAYLKASNTGAGDNFGRSVDIDADTIVVGAYREDSMIISDQTNNNATDSGAAYVFVRSGTVWTQQAYLKASNPDPYDSFGLAVSVDGDTIVVGTSGESSSSTGVNGNQLDNSASSSGAVYVFVRSGTSWTQQAYLKASNTGSSDQFGCSVSLSGDTAVVGAVGEASSATGVNGNQGDDSLLYSGAVYVFVRSGTTWTQEAYLKASNTDMNDNFGFSVGIDVDRIVVGAYSEDSSSTGVNGNQIDNSADQAGAVYVFFRSGNSWTQESYLKASNTDSFDNFGHTVGISGDKILIGAPHESSSSRVDQMDNSSQSSGAAYLFVRNTSSSLWTQEEYIKAEVILPQQNFGYVGIDMDVIALGAAPLIDPGYVTVLTPVSSNLSKMKEFTK